VSLTKKLLTVAVAVVALMAVAGTAVGATRYVISSLSQISPTVVKQLHGATGPRGPAGPAGPAGQGAAFVTHGSVGTLAKTATTVASMTLSNAPALVEATVDLTNGDFIDDVATCTLKLDGQPAAPAFTLDVPGQLTPQNNQGTASTTFSAAVASPGTLVLACLDVNGAGTIAAQGSISALTTGTATNVDPVPAPTPTS
jgi:hypothetical protein